MGRIDNKEDLRQLYKMPSGKAVDKQLDFLDQHCKHFIAQSPFLIMATSDAQSRSDASPRGGEKGFVHVLDDVTLLLPDWVGNNRLDSFENIIETGQIGLIFLLPGVDETLRVNGKATLETDQSLRELCKEGEKLPKLVIRIVVEDAYLHCAKALMRSKLWDASQQIPREDFPSMGQMLKDQIGFKESAEPQVSMVERYKNELY